MFKITEKLENSKAISLEEVFSNLAIAAMKSRLSKEVIQWADIK